MSKKTYFIAPNYDIAIPPDGPVQLGHIVEAPDAPDIEPINVDGRVEIIKQLPVAVKTGFSSTRGRLLSGELGLWAQIMASIGGHASVGFENSTDDVMKIDRLETHAFQPTEEYVDASCKASEVARYLKQTDYKSPIYMITGLRIAKGFSQSNDKSRSFNTSVEVNVPIQGVDIGPKVDLKRSKTDNQSFEGSTDFILAIRLQRIRFRYKNGVATIRDRGIYTKGAQMLDGSQRSGQIEVETFELDKQSDDLPTDGLKFDDVVDTDDGEACEIVRLA